MRTVAAFSSLLLAVLLTVSVGSSCAKKDEATAPPVDAGAPAPTVATPADLAGLNGDPMGGDAHGGMPPSQSAIAKLAPEAPILKVDGVVFTRADLDRTMTQHAAAAGVPPGMLAGAMRDAFEKASYDKLIERHLLAAEAKRTGAWPNDEQLKKERDQLLASLPPGKTLKDALTAMGSDEATFDRDITSDIAIKRLLEREKDALPSPADDVLQKVYAENVDKFKVKDSASAMHILVKVAENASPADVAAALEKAKAVRHDVEGKDAATFQKVAREKSEDPSAAQNGGDLGTFERGEMVKVFDDAAFSLKKDELSQPVRSEFGFHVIRGGGTKPGGQKTFAEVKAMIADREKMKAFMGRIDTLLVDLKGKAKIERLVEPVASPMGDDDGAPPPGGAPVPPPKP